MTDITFSDEQKKRLTDFLQGRTQVKDRKIATRFHDSDAHVYDMKFISPHLEPHCNVLDLGAGSGILAFEAARKVNRVVAVEKFSEFYSSEYRDDKIEVVAADIMDYRTQEKFDIVILFGVITYFDYEQSRIIYASIDALLKDGGVLLAKHGCALKDDVFVDGYSEQLQNHYVALYKNYETERKLLEKHFSVGVTDIYPDHLNRWENTRYFGFTCRKSLSRP